MAEDQEFTLPPLEERPLVTFALFAYNQEKYIREAVEGAFAQTYEPLEIILSDDCSTDRTFEIMENLVSKYAGPHKVKLDRTPTNLGKNTFGRRVSNVLAKCRGSLIVFSAGDDISFASRTSRLFEAWQRSGYKKISLHSKVKLINDNGEQLEGEAGWSDIAKQPLHTLIQKDGRGLIGAAHAIDARLFTEFGRLPDKILIEDGALAFRARLSDGIVFIEEPLLYYRRHSQNLTNQRELKTHEDFNLYLTSLLGLHSSYISDYTSRCEIADRKVIKSFRKKLESIERMTPLFTGDLLARTTALASYSHNLSIKRRLTLLFRIIRRKNLLSDEY